MCVCGVEQEELEGAGGRAGGVSGGQKEEQGTPSAACLQKFPPKSAKFATSTGDTLTKAVARALCPLPPPSLLLQLATPLCRLLRCQVTSDNDDGDGGDDASHGHFQLKVAAQLARCCRLVEGREGQGRVR